MQISIHLNEEHRKKDRTKLFNRLAKTTAILAIPLALYGTYRYFTESSEPAANNNDHTLSGLPPKTVTNLNLYGSIILSSASLFLRRRYITEKNLNQQFVTHFGNKDTLLDIINAEKIDIGGSYYAHHLYDRSVEAGEAVTMPFIHPKEEIFPYLFMDESDIKTLPPYAKCMAYLVQIKCMNQMTAAVTGAKTWTVFSPNIPLAQGCTNANPLYDYDDILNAFQQQHTAEHEKFSRVIEGLAFNLTEKVDAEKVTDSIRKGYKINGIWTAAAAIVAPAAASLYSTTMGYLNNFHFEREWLMDRSPFPYLRKDLENQVRDACGEPRIWNFTSDKRDRYRLVDIRVSAIQHAPKI